MPARRLDHLLQGGFPMHFCGISARGPEYTNSRGWKRPELGSTACAGLSLIANGLKRLSTYSLKSSLAASDDARTAALTRYQVTEAEETRGAAFAPGAQLQEVAPHRHGA